MGVVLGWDGAPKANVGLGGSGCEVWGAADRVEALLLLAAPKILKPVEGAGAVGTAALGTEGVAGFCP